MNSLRQTLMADLVDAVEDGDDVRAAEIRSQLNALFSAKVRETRAEAPGV